MNTGKWWWYDTKPTHIHGDYTGPGWYWVDRSIEPASAVVVRLRAVAVAALVKLIEATNREGNAGDSGHRQ